MGAKDRGRRGASLQVARRCNRIAGSMGADLSKDYGMCCDCSQQRNQILETEVNGVSSMKLHENNQRFLRAMAEGGKSDLILGLFSTTREFDVNACDEAGESALHKAARHGHVIVCHVLIKRGARPDLKNSEGKSALDLAREHNHTECVEYLQEPGCVSVPALKRAHHRRHLPTSVPPANINCCCGSRATPLTLNLRRAETRGW